MPATQMKKGIQRKLRIQSKNKSYSLKDSSLYKLTTKKRLVNELFHTIVRLEKLASDSNYKVFSIKKPNGEPRWIETPNDSLNCVHTRIASLLVRIKQPGFVHSGVKGRSNITNAKAHLGDHPVLTMDLRNFYPSVTKKSIYHFFHQTMQVSPDVAGILAELCTYKDHIPTGSRISMPLSFWANNKMYTDIYKLCHNRGVKMSVYVDDLTFSGKLANSRLEKDVSLIVSGAGLIVHPEKTRLFRRDEPKLITGVVVKGSDLRVRNKHHKAIYNLFNERDRVTEIEARQTIERQLLGHLNAAGQVDSRFKQRAITFRSTKNAPTQS